MVIEGLHIEPELFYSYSNDLDVNLFLLTVSDHRVHKERIKQKCNYRPELMDRLDKYFPKIRTLQDLLTEEAKKYHVKIVETGSNLKEPLGEIKEYLK